MATIKQVAEAAGVSIATVSHVINSTRYVSPELSLRVQDAMASLGYTPDGTARSLRRGRTNTIGLIVPDNSNPFFAELARILEDIGFDAGYTTIFGNSGERPDRERKYIETLISKRVDGLIVAATVHQPSEVESLLFGSTIPVVMLDRDIRLSSVDIVLTDHFGGGYSAARHLLELGHHEFACIAGPEHSPSEDRVSGFIRALADSGRTLAAEQIVRSDFRLAGGRAAAAELLDRRLPFSALFVANDQMALGALAELAARGRAVPGEISVVGFDDAPFSDVLSPRLTTMRQRLSNLARTALELLLARIEGERSEAGVRRVIPAELVVRESTAPPGPEASSDRRR